MQEARGCGKLLIVLRWPKTQGLTITHQKGA